MEKSGGFLMLKGCRMEEQEQIWMALVFLAPFLGSKQICKILRCHQ